MAEEEEKDLTKTEVMYAVCTDILANTFCEIQKSPPFFPLIPLGRTKYKKSKTWNENRKLLGRKIEYIHPILFNYNFYSDFYVMEQNQGAKL